MPSRGKLMLEDDVGQIVDIRFKLHSTFCNLWPNCKIVVNDETLFDGQVVESLDLTKQFTIRENNSIVISHYGKRFGENRIWDTKSAGDQIVADRTLHVDDMLIMGISMKPWWHKGSMDIESQVPKNSSIIHFYFNASYSLSFTAPFYDWLIDSRYEGFKEVGPIWKMSSLNTKSDGYSSSMLELEPLLDRIQDTINKL